MADKETVATTYYTKVYPGHLLPQTYLYFVIMRWARSFRYGNDYIRLTDSAAYFDRYKSYISKILQFENSVVRLAVLSDDPDVALGFSVVSGNTLHYVYVGTDYRHNGIGTMLVPLEVKDFTHLTKVGLKLWKKKAPRAIFNPFR